MAFRATAMIRYPPAVPGALNGLATMINYDGFVQSFAVLFIVAPFFVGAAAGVIWARRGGRRGRQLILPALLSGVLLTLFLFIVTVLLLRF